MEDKLPKALSPLSDFYDFGYTVYVICGCSVLRPAARIRLVYFCNENTPDALIEIKKHENKFQKNHCGGIAFGKLSCRL